MIRLLVRLAWVGGGWLLIFTASSAHPRSPDDPSGVIPGISVEVLAFVQWPAEIQCAADGRCYVAVVHDPQDEERSAIWVINLDGAAQRLYRGLSYDPNFLGEKGLTGLALHPRFPQDDRLFFYWTIPNHSRSEPTISVISSIRSDGGDYHELWSFTTGKFTDAHVAGGLVTYTDNGRDYLFVAVGEYGASGSQDVTKGQGKIHRFEIVADTLQAPNDNPFYNTPGAVRSIWAVGLRNPFRMTRDPATGKVYVTENGFTCSDRVYVLARGGNYGWPAWDACQDNPGYVQPILEFRPSIGITDIEVYHGPILNWEGRVFICGFNSQPLRMFSVGAGDRLTNEQVIADEGQGCLLALATRADGSLLYSRQDSQGYVLIVKAPAPRPRLQAMLSTSASQPAPAQRLHYTLDVTSLASTVGFTAVVPLPVSLIYLPDSTFGGAIYLSNTQQVQWRPTLEISRSLRAGFDAATLAAPGTPITVTAYLTDSLGLVYTTSTTLVVGGQPPFEARILANPAGIASGQSTQLQYLFHNRSISDTTFAVTTTLPGEAEFVRHVFTATTTYDVATRATAWQRRLKADRPALAAVAVSATQGSNRTIGFTTTIALGSGVVFDSIATITLDPLQVFLPSIVQDPSRPLPYRLAPEGHPFEQRGTPPGRVNNLIGPDTCRLCHNVAGSSIYAAWATSAHGYGAIDPVFDAALHNARQQVKDVERWCTQCHRPANWLSGHPLNESAPSGVTCSICHRAVAADSAAPIDQAAIQEAQAMGVVPPRRSEIGGNGALIIDHDDVRRGANFLNPAAPHPTAQSLFQGSSALCGSCHSVYAPHLARDEITGEFAPGAPDVAQGDNPFFLQSTYPEWLNSSYAVNGQQCQDCHMPLKPGYVASPDQGGQPRDVPDHRLAGGNLFILDIFDQIGGLGDTTEARAGVTHMLTQAVAMTATASGSTLAVDVTCLAGHKCPTGYEEGRAWILQVEQLDQNGQRLACSGCWDDVNHTISGYEAQPADADYDPELTEFAVHLGVTGTHALQLGLAPGATFNLALNNVVIGDTRIPPCGWDANVYAALGIAPTEAYAPGSCTATAHYALQPGVKQVNIRLLHWSHTTPYLKFLRDVGGAAGQTLWNAWQAALASGAGRPVVIASQILSFR